MSADGDGVRVVLLENREDAAGPAETLLNGASASADARSGPPLDVHAVGRLSAGLRRLEREPPDVVLLGADLPDSPGLDGLDEVLDCAPGVPVVVLTDPDGREAGARAIERGAREHLVTDDLAADDLAAALRAAAGHVRPTALLAAVNRFSRVARDAESRAALAERTVETVRSDLHLPLAAVVRYAEPDDGFEVEARSPLTAALGPISVREDGESAIWRAFVADEPARIEPDAAGFDGALAERSVSELVAVPLGGHGVLLAGSTSAEGAGAARREALEGVGGSAREALDRLDRERALAAREEELRARSDRLREVNRIDALIRELTTAIVTATTREEIERAVCRRLVDAEPYGFAWIGEYDRAKEEVTPRTAARGGGARPETATAGEGTIADGGLARKAARAGEPQIRNVFDEPPLEPWRREALERGHGSVIAAPISYRGTLYSVLTIYADEPDAFTSRVESMVSKITETVAHAINALETKRSLASDSLVELEFEIADPDVLPVRLTAETGGAFELAAVESRSDASLTVFFTTEGVPPARVSAFAADADAVASISHIAEYEGTSTFVCHLAEPSFFSSAIDQGALVSAFVADGGRGRVRVQLPKTANVHSFVEMVQTRYRDAELAARREREQPIQTRHGFRAEFERTLTDRQLEVLRVAYFSGYFDWPRERTGQEIAESLGVSQPTVNRHLRISQQKLCRLLFDD